MTQSLERITHPAKKTATHCIIWMHGLGADGNDFAPIVPMLNLADHTRIIFPHAPIRPVTLNNGHKMRAWYDLVSLEMRQDDMAGIRQSDEQIKAIIDEQSNDGIAAKNILLAGFSQGGAMALYTGLRTPCAGILALSCYLLDAESVPNKNDSYPLPIMLMHGQHDAVVIYELGQQAYAQLQSLGYQPQWKSYAMGHEVNPLQINDIATWLNSLGF